jgi:sporulation-control protein spo0M
MVAVGSFAKALVAAVAAGSATLATVLADGSLGTGDIVTVALAVLGALGITYVVPNSPTSVVESGGKHAAE